MDYKAFIYNAFSFILYCLAYPFILATSSPVVRPALLIYVVARCSGYPRTIAIALVKQAQLETGNFTSKAYLQANNLFGMRHPSVRETLSLGEFNAGEIHSNLAKFRTLAHSVLDRILWDDYFNISKDADQVDYMIQVQSKVYAVDDRYLDKWENIEPKLDFNLGSLVASFYTMIAIALVLWKYKR